MRSFQCRCEGKLFFRSVDCVRCEAVVARCPGCHHVSPMSGEQGDALTCDHCGESCRLCQNRVSHAVCNAAVHQHADSPLCRYCGMNEVIPDLAIESNLHLWRLLEQAKHRVLFDVDRSGFPIVTDSNSTLGPKLVFEFKAADEKPVSTGHASGRITIDIAEADSVHRERTRVEFGEPQRTLVGHFRHELGHYFWEVCVRSSRLEHYRDLFGDERTPTYREAQRTYYEQGALPNWQASYVSQYATMHPWEDFAETFNAYLDMIAIVGTSSFFGNIRVQADRNDFDALFNAYREIGIVANELNRDMGLLDLVPEVFTPPVVEKLRFVHSLRTVP